MADAAERAAVMADWFGSEIYPKQRLKDAWIRFIWHQFHDDLTGTSIWEAYNYSWNDEIIAMNQFAGVLEDATAGVIRSLETKGTGIPVVVYNPLSFERNECVKATLTKEIKYAKVLDFNFKEVPCQIIGSENGKTSIIFNAKVPSVGFAVYDIQSFDIQPVQSTKNVLNISLHSMENELYKVAIDTNGDICSIFNKQIKKELLSSPIRLQLLNDTSSVYPAWEILYKTIQSSPRSYVDQKVKIEMVEKGPVRISLKVSRQKEGSTFVEFIRLSSNSKRIEIENEIKWSTYGTLLKSVFPLTISNKATYDLGFGTIERGINKENIYEVPAQQWADITQSNGSFGVSILNDCKYGWDKPADNTLRLTIFHTPKTTKNFNDQENIDIGTHYFKYAIMGHKGDWRNGTIQEAACVNQPLIAFQSEPFKGEMGRIISFVSINNKSVMIRALKKAENTDEIVIRLQEIYGKEVQGVKIKFPMRIKTAREINGAEEPVANLSLKDTILNLSFNPYQIRSFAIKLANPSQPVNSASSIDLGIDYNIDVVSPDSSMYDGNIIDGLTLPLEQFPSVIDYHGIKFKMGIKGNGHMNAMVAKGDKITLPNIPFKSVYILAASIKNDETVSFKIDEKNYPVDIQSMFENIGQWFKPQWISTKINEQKIEYFNLENSYIKRDNIAWYATHLHNGYSNTNMIYKFGYIFFYKIDLPQNAKILNLPNDENLIIFAISLGSNYNDWIKPAIDLYDRADYVSPIKFTTSSNNNIFTDSIAVSLFTQRPDQKIYYTIDGSTPDENSPVYKSILNINKTTILKAKVFIPGNETGYELSVPFIKGSYMPSIHYNKIEPGLELDIFQGNWNVLPLFDTLNSVSRVAIDNFHIANNFLGQDNFGHRFKGYINIPMDGMYTFYLSSVEGSLLKIDHKNIIINDGIHSSYEKSGSVILKAGLHEILLDYFQANGNEELSLLLSGPNMKKQLIPASILFRKKDIE